MEGLPSDVLGSIGGMNKNGTLCQVSKSMDSAITGSDTYLKTKIAEEFNLHFSNMNELYAALKSQNKTVLSFETQEALRCRCAADNLIPHQCEHDPSDRWCIVLLFRWLTQTSKVYFQATEQVIQDMRKFASWVEKGKPCYIFFLHETPNEISLWMDDDGTFHLNGACAYANNQRSQAGNYFDLPHLHPTNVVRVFRQIIQFIAQSNEEHKEKERIKTACPT
jgi:hypothetical protein